MTILCIAPSKDTVGRKDASGAFIPMARRFLGIHREVPGKLSTFDPTLPMRKRRSEVRSLVGTLERNLSTVAFFCHGWKDGIQAGWTDEQLVDLVSMLLTRTTDGSLKRVILYACDSGRDGDLDREDDLVPGPGGDGGFADLLRDQFATFGASVDVFAHTTAGHTTSNPYVRVFYGAKSPQAGGPMLVAPKSPLWGDWRRALRDTDLWAHFPFLSQEELLMDLEAMSRAGSLRS